MADVVRQVRQELPLIKPPTYAGQCCRVWELAYGIPVGRCGLCGERPTFLGWID